MLLSFHSLIIHPPFGLSVNAYANCKVLQTQGTERAQQLKEAAELEREHKMYRPRMSPHAPCHGVKILSAECLEAQGCHALG